MKRDDEKKRLMDQLLIKEKQFLNPDFSATRLAELMGVPNYTLSRAIKAWYGTSYSGVVHTLRIQEAARLLRDKRYAPYSVDDIGAIVGFRNRLSFFSAFKKMTGMTPDRFRKGEPPAGLWPTH